MGGLDTLASYFIKGRDFLPVFYEKTYTIDTRDIDPFNTCRPSALLGILQEAATAAAVELHVSREDIIPRYNAFWMLARIWFTLDRPLHWDERVTVKTWHRGGKGASMYRDFDLSVGGVQVGEAVSTWVVADLAAHKLLRLSNMEEFAGTGGGELCKAKMLNKLRMPEDMALVERRRLHYSDADINGHVNNARYADFACDALGMEALGRERFVSSLQLGYLAECLPGEELDLLTIDQDGTHYVRGIGDAAEPRFDAALTLKKLPLDTHRHP